MRFRRGASLDSSQVSDRRGAAPLAIGGGGLIGVIALVITLLGGGDPGQLMIGGVEADNTELSAACTTGDDANQREDCRIVGVVNSVQEFWTATLRDYREANTVFFEQATQTGCGSATSAVGPFYCPPDQMIYIDLGFYDDLRTRFGASGGPFAEAFVIAHEYGHHVENLMGVFEGTNRSETGPQSDAVRVELMADCYAGMWAAGAIETGFIEELTDDDIRDGLDAAAAVGDDRIQEANAGEVQPESWTHGSAEQRQRWFMVGYDATSIEDCDTLRAERV